MRELEGELNGAGLKVAIVVSRFHTSITDNLLSGALEKLRTLGVADDDLLVVRVPGALELPQAAERVLLSQRPHAVIALGCVIRGETDHYDFVCAETTRGCGRLAHEYQVPMLFGLLTCDTQAQAVARSAPGPDNKGAHCAEGAVQMARLFGQLDDPETTP
ncbi:MAG: 6,7-dimethyl-8-ribityllumazine synthase [Planctomycetota bacterium]|nr:MAG: 6,7-dimethyl-8-ribityllumazine synthase [Planctomycetota bacterium]